MTNPITREKCLEVCGYAPEDKAPFVMSEEELVIFVRASVALGMEMAADFVESQRNDIPATGEEFATAIRKLAEEVQRG